MDAEIARKLQKDEIIIHHPTSREFKVGFVDEVSNVAVIDDLIILHPVDKPNESIVRVPSDLQYFDKRILPADVVKAVEQHRAKCFMDGSVWCFLKGIDLQKGVAGFGNTPEKALADFYEKLNK